MATLGSNFCLAPFTQLTFGPAGKFSPCPEIGGRPWRDPEASPIKMWSSSELDSIRNDFKDNKQNPVCNRCWSQESVKKQSLRRRLYVERKMFNPGETLNFIDNEYHNGPKQINIMTGNTCNLRCRICSADSSWTYNIEGRIYEKLSGEKSVYTSDSPKPLRLSEQQLDEVYTLSENLQRLEFYGGEPLLDDKTVFLLEKYVSDGSSKDISLMYNTNGQNLPTKQHFELWPKFKSVDFNISIDDIEHRYTYNRHPGKWEDLLIVLDSLKSHNANFNIFSICTVSTLNIFYIPEILDEIDRLGLKCFINNVHDPKYYDIQFIPNDIKHKIKQKLLSYKNQSRIQFLMNMLDLPEDLEAWEQFRFWTNTKDDYRNEDFATTYPEFYEVIKHYDITRQV